MEREPALIIAGPCAVESRRQMHDIARALKNMGVTTIRGGAYKPRTNPSSFQGLGRKGIDILADVREELGVQIVTEVIDDQSVNYCIANGIDRLQVGTRNATNYALLAYLGMVGKPVLLKRGMSSQLDEWLSASRYITGHENAGDIILCERGIRTFSDHSRFTLDLSVIPLVKKATPLRIIVDPSHATGRRESVLPMASAALAAGADGVMIEVHDNPEKSVCDASQAVSLQEFERWMREV